MTVSTKIDICSSALLLLSHPAISSLDEIGAGPALCKQLYPITYETFLGDSNWTFATKTQELSQLDNDVEDTLDYQYVYELPSDYLRITSTENIQNYSIQGNRLYSNYGKVRLEYQAYMDENQIPAGAIECLTYKLAAKLAVPLTNDAKKAEMYSTLYTTSLQQAKYNDSQNQPGGGFIHSPLTSVRF